jgi:NADH-quinone oxidoreductase subunit J
MGMSVIIFYLISCLILVSGLLSVTSRRIFRSAVFLLFSLVGIAGLYFWMEVEFIAAVQIIIYAGGILVLIIFSIFLTQKSGDKMPKPLKMRSLFSGLAVVVGFGFTFNLIHHYGFINLSSQPFEVKVSDIGTQMLSTTEYGFILPFEVVSILLLSAMIGCIVIAMKSKTPEQPVIKKISKPEIKREEPI